MLTAHRAGAARVEQALGGAHPLHEVTVVGDQSGFTAGRTSAATATTATWGELWRRLRLRAARLLVARLLWLTVLVQTIARQ